MGPYLKAWIVLAFANSFAHADFSGTVKNSGGAPVSGCIVSWAGDGTYTRSSAYGEFTLARIPNSIRPPSRDDNRPAGDIFTAAGRLIGIGARIATIPFVNAGRTSTGPRLSKAGAGQDSVRVLCDGYTPVILAVTADTGRRSITVAKPVLDKPNILFAIADDWSYPHASFFGAKMVKTPAFDRVAREGAVFHHAFYSAPQCQPDRASIVTGRRIWENEEGGSHASWMPEFLQDAYADGTAVHAPGLKAPVHLDVFEPRLTAQGYLVGYAGKGVEPNQPKRTADPLGRRFAARTLKPPTTGIANDDYAADFRDMLAARKSGQPFFFWYGAHESHRPYGVSSGVDLGGKNVADAELPPAYPDQDAIREDFLDYAFEVEWFDSHLSGMIDALEKAGELENTVIIVTGDNGMPFPRAKANLYDDGSRAPFAVRWGSRIKPGRKVDDFIEFSDLAPTFLELAGAQPAATMTGRSFLPLLLDQASGRIDPSRDRAYFGMERHSSARPDNVGYPMRALRTRDFLYIRNLKPDRWPAGDPPASGAGCAFDDIDDGTTASLFRDFWSQSKAPGTLNLSLGKRPAEELYDVRTDSSALHNLAADPAYARVKDSLWEDLEGKLIKGGDPRVLGYGDVWDSYPRFDKQKCTAGWYVEGQYNPAYWQKAIGAAAMLGITIRQIK